MSNETSGTSDQSTGKSLLYWLAVYAIVIPSTFVVTGIIVRTTLAMSH